MKRASAGLIAASILLASANALADREKIAVVTSGDCRDPELISAARDLGKELAHKDGIQLVDEPQILEKLGRGPTRSIDEIQRQIDTAQQQFYSAQYHKAIDQLESALAEIQRLPPGAAHWQLWVSASILEGLTRSRLKKGSGSEDAFRRVVRIDPTYQLDPDYFAPSTVALFERIRKETAALKKVRLLVKSTPSGATVFIDGRSMGKTPFSTELPRGTYQVVIGRDDVFSLPREVTVEDETDLHIDLRFESAIDTQRAPCISSANDEKTRLANAVKLGSVLDVDQLVVLRFDRQKVGPSWLAATLVGVSGGEKIREGGLQVAPRGITPQGISELARFVATGEATPNVVPQPSATPVAQAAPPAPTPQSPPADGTSTGSEPASANSSAVPATASLSTSAEPSPGWRRPTGITLVGIGAAAVLTGAYFQSSALQANAEYEDWVARGSKIEGAQAAREAKDRSASHQIIALTGFGIGAVAVGTGLFLWLGAHDSGEGTANVAVVPSEDGGALVMSGTF